MRQLWAVTASLLLLSGLFLGCSRTAKKEDGENKGVAIDPNVKVAQPVLGNDGKPQNGDAAVKPVVLDASKQDKYDAAIGDALVALADHKWNDALAAYETARGFQDTEFVQSEISKLKARIDQDVAAKDTVKNIETVINDGKADDAAKLAKDALNTFGDGDDAAKLVQLRLQAEALKNAEKEEAKDARYARFKKEAEDALAEKNLRAAALALEQAVLARDDADLQKIYDDVRGKLDAYDTLRKKAAELRQDPLQIDDAIAALKDAQAAWDTLQIRQDLDEYQLAKQRRREIVSVADFELRGDVGMADAGSSIADELLPLLKPRYDLVERGQLKRIIGELRLGPDFARDPKQQAQLGKVANVRYLVVGSVSRLAGVSIRARLVDVQTGLVVQTGKVLALTMEDAMNQMPDLAKQLLLSDDDKMKLEQQQQKDAPPVPVVAADAVLPAAPMANAPAAPPAPLINAAAPGFDNAKPAAFAKFAAPPADGAALPQQMPLDGGMRNRMLFAAVEMGDMLFRNGRFADAKMQYDIALTLDPNNFDIRMRLAQVLPLVPPPAPMLIVVQQPVYVRPRIAVMPFMTVGDPFLMSPALSYWTPTNLAPYLSSRYEVVDPSVVYWYMARVGMSMNDLLVDPNARRWLGRATGVRYFVFGSHIQTTSFDVNTYLIDAEFGTMQGQARINVQDAYELKLRLPELASLTMMTPDERAAFLTQQQQFELLVRQGRRHMERRDFDLAIPDFQTALSIRPYNVQVQWYLAEAQRLTNLFGWEIARRRQWEAQQAAYAAARQRQLQLAQASQLASQQAVVYAASLSPAQRQTRINFRFGAQAQLVAQAQFALQTKRFGISVNFFQGAMNFNQPANAEAPVQMPSQTVIYQNFAQARLGAERGEQLRIAQFTAAREQAVRQQRDQQLQQAQQQIVTNQQTYQANLSAISTAQTTRDDSAYKDAMAQGQRYLAQNKFEAALAAFQGAQRFKQTDTVNLLIETTVQRQAEALAKSDKERQAIEQKFAVERDRRKAAETKAKQGDDNYKAALQLAQQALAQKNYDMAQAKFQEAGSHFKTDAVLTGLRQVDAGRAAAVAVTQKGVTEKTKADTIQQLMTTGKTALASNDHPAALKAFQQAKKLAPDNIDVVAGLTQAELANNRLKAQAQETSRTQDFQKLLKNGQANLTAKQYDAAVANLTEATKLNPADATAQAALKQAIQARDGSASDAKAQAAAKQRTDAYQKSLNDGRSALAGKRYADAIKSFADAQKLIPGDKTSKDYLQEAQTAKQAAEDAVAAASKLKVQQDYQAALSNGQKALQGKDYNGAIRSAQQALKIMPNDVQATQLLQQAQDASNQEAKAQASFKLALDAGRNSLSAKNYKDAVTAFNNALQLNPGDATAKQLLQQAQQALADANKNQVAVNYQKAMTAGQAAFSLKRYSDAALKWMPNDQKATQGLQQAQLALTPPKIKTPTPVDPPATNPYDQAMQKAAGAEKNQKYADAVKAYAEALKARPKDKDALTGWNKNQYAVNMAQGQQYLNNMMWLQAQGEFESALRIFPGDANATKGLQRAKNKK